MYVLIGIIALLGILCGSLISYMGFDNGELPKFFFGVVLFLVSGLIVIIH